MKKSISFICLFLTIISAQVNAQSIKGKMISLENKLALSDVSITDSLGVLVSSSNHNGLFSLNQSGLYHFSKPGYIAKSIRIKGFDFNIITLTEKPLELGEVIVKSDHFQSELKKVSSAVSIITTTRIKSSDLVNIAPLLNSVSGVYMHNGTLSTNRITIRGIGSRNLFGTSKIRAYYEDIPLTNGSGETTIEDIELQDIARMEILKGPSSSLYGAGLGGTIQLIPDKGLFDTNSFQANYTFGSYGLQKIWLNTNLGNKKNAAKISYSNTKNEGYRENNELERQTITLASNHYLNEKNSINVIGNFIDLKAYIPSSLNENDYINKPSKAAFTWSQAQGFEEYDKLLLGLSWQHDYSEKSKQISSVFGSILDSYEARPFNIQDQNTAALGLRTRFIHYTQLLGKKFQWTAGLEIFNDMNRLKTYENLYKDYPEGTGSVQGPLIGDFDENRYYLNLFSEAQIELSKKVQVDIGLNMNHTGYRLDDNYNPDNEDLSGDYGFDIILSPKIGLNFQIDPSRMIFATISHGFSPPKLEETLLPDGLINNDIKPETGWNYEIGSRGKIIKNIFNYEVSVYLMDINNLLVARRTGDDQFIGVNAGNTIHKGIEIGLNYYLIQKEAVQLSHSNSISINDFSFQDFQDLDEDYSGNDLTGVPDRTVYSELYLNTKSGFYAYLNYQFVGQIPLRDDNSIYADSYQLVNSKTGYRTVLGKHFQLDAYVGLNNIFDEKYASMLQINAGSFGNNAPRYYYPGLPRNYFVGLNLQYTF